MGCTMAFNHSLTKAEFFTEDSHQKILIDILSKYSEMDRSKMASIVGVSIDTLQDISDDKVYLEGEQAENLAQLFLMFLGKHFFRGCTFVRDFSDKDVIKS